MLNSWTRVVAGCLATLVAAGTALATPDNDLAGLTNREYVDYARDRFEWLTGEARAGHHLEAKARHDCKAGAPQDSDAGRACEIARAAAEQNQRILQEGRDLMQGLQQRLGGVPPWARSADQALIAAGHSAAAPSQQQQHP